MTTKIAARHRSSVMAPPGRTRKSENFPVASRLLWRRERAKVLAFYAFARAADDVADDPRLTAGEKLFRLRGFEEGLEGPGGAPEAAGLRAALGADAASLSHARDLLGAFRQDAAGAEYAAWDDLLEYCAMSANPVGRFLLDLHGEDARAAAPSDALCTALQVLNHLQDLRQDRDRLGRVYLPADWLREAGVTPDALSAPGLSGGGRRVVDRALDACDRLLAAAAPLPDAIAAPGLRAQAAATHHLARRLSHRLRRQDPLAGRVSVGRTEIVWAGLAAALRRRVRPA